jgi:hypothetical protein
MLGSITIRTDCSNIDLSYLNASNITIIPGCIRLPFISIIESETIKEVNIKGNEGSKLVIIGCGNIKCIRSDTILKLLYLEDLPSLEELDLPGCDIMSLNCVPLLKKQID